MRHIISFFLLFSSFFISAFAQEVKEMERPKLVVGIMVDQMRWDYLTRYYDRYGDGGFKRLMNDGYNCNRVLINYIPTVTAVGHTSVYTGTVPAFNGIIANNFPVNGKWGTSVSDKSVQTVGSTTKAGQASPHNLLVTTMTDELRIATNFRSKTIGVALKDRASILPAGHSATAAYWFDGKDLSWVTSTYYMDALPQWVKNFNNKKLGQKYLAELQDKKKDKDGYWDLMYDRSTYVQSTANLKERYFKPVADYLGNSPYGLIITTDMALAAIDGEQMGHNPAGVPDFLAVSYSSTDMVGHQHGPNSIWIEDMYLHLDKEIARILTHLDETVGKGNYIVFLAADHAGSHNVEFRRDHKLPAAPWEYYPETDTINKFLTNFLNPKPSSLNPLNLVTSLNSNNVYFDNAVIDSIAKVKGVGFKELKDKILAAACEYFESLQEVAYCFPFRNVPTYVPEPVRTMAVNGYNPKRSGDLQIVLEANVTENFDAGYVKDYDGITRGTNHCVWSPYDTHIPFIVMGKGIHHAWDNTTYHIVDIAPTICSLLNIQQPSGCIGDAIKIQ